MYDWVKRGVAWHNYRPSGSRTTVEPSGLRLRSTAKLLKTADLHFQLWLKSLSNVVARIESCRKLTLPSQGWSTEQLQRTPFNIRSTLEVYHRWQQFHRGPSWHRQRDVACRCCLRGLVAHVTCVPCTVAKDSREINATLFALVTSSPLSSIVNHSTNLMVQCNLIRFSCFKFQYFEFLPAFL